LTSSAQPKLISSHDREAIIFGLCDRLWDHGHCITNVVLAPAKEDGSPDWQRAAPECLESLPADEWPDDDQTARRVAVSDDGIDGCARDTSYLLWVDDDGQVQHGRIAGLADDEAIAEAIIARDIGAEPPKRERGRVAQAAEKLRQDLFPLKPANDNAPPAAALSLKPIDPAELADKPVPARQWYIDGLIPARNVTLLSGDGGTGKSLLALQIAVAGALGISTLGLTPQQGRTLVLAAEDDQDEIHRRLADICREHAVGMAGLRDRMLVIPAAGEDVELASLDASRRHLLPTKVYEALLDQVALFRPSLIVLDTSADLFGGDEINRNQVRRFIGMLRALAIAFDTAVVLLSHPSVQGMQTGTGTSGSTAWNNSVRSRLYLTADKDDEDLRVLKGMKSNYGRKGEELRLRWRDGVFVIDDGRSTASSALLHRKAAKVFLEVLGKFNEQGINVSANTGPTYAPKRIAEHPDADGMSKKVLAEAMQRLMDSGQIRMITEGSKSRQRSRLIAS